MRYSSMAPAPMTTGPPPLIIPLPNAAPAAPTPDTSGDEEMARALHAADLEAGAIERNTDYLEGLIENLDNERITALNDDGLCEEEDLFGRDDDVFDVVVNDEDERVERELFGYVPRPLQPVTSSTSPSQLRKKRRIKMDPEEEGNVDTEEAETLVASPHLQE